MDSLGQMVEILMAQMPPGHLLGMQIALTVDTDLEKQKGISDGMKELLGKSYHALAVSIANVCQDGSFNPDSEKNALTILVRPGGSWVTAWNLKKMSAKEGSFEMRPNTEEDEVWAVIDSLLEGGEGAEAAYGIMCFQGREFIQKWIDALDASVGTPNIPVLIVATATESMDDEHMRMGGVICLTEMPRAVLSGKANAAMPVAAGMVDGNHITLN